MSRKQWAWRIIWICSLTTPLALAQVEDIEPMYDETGEPMDERPDFQEDEGLNVPEFDTADPDSEAADEIDDTDTQDLGFRPPSAEDEAESDAEGEAEGEAESEEAIDDPLEETSSESYSDPAIFAGEDLPEFHQRNSEFSLGRRDPNGPRSYWWPALLSIPLPGFGQWYDGQYEWAAGYSGVATAGATFAMANVPDSQGVYESNASYQNRQMFGVRERKFVLGLQVFQTAGGLSAYHSFRTAVRTRQPMGQFGFLRKEESIAEILLAPFDFRYLARPTTIIPLAVGAALYVGITEFHREIDSDLRRRDLEGSDVVFASAYSFNAGTHEEAVFRGWVQPMFFHLTSGRSIWSNLITSGIFAAAHLPSNPTPLPQFALSMHLGWVTERNDWTLAESVFIHTWWDVLAFFAQYQVMVKEGPDSKIEPALHLPPLEFRF